MSEATNEQEARLPAIAARLILGAAVLALALWFARESIALQSIPGADKVGPGAFPGLVALIMALAAVMMLAGFREVAAAPFVVERPARVLLALLALLGFVIALGEAPILVAIATFSLLLQLIFGERRPLALLLGAGGLTFSVWLLFGQLLRVPL